MLVLQMKKQNKKFNLKFADRGLKCQVCCWHPAFVSEGVKGSGSAVVVVWWRMGLLRAPLLSRAPGVRGRWG